MHRLIRRMPRPAAWTFLLAGGALLLASGWAGAEDPATWYRRVTINGLVSTSYGLNTNRPDSRTNQFRVFDQAEGTFQLDVAELAIQKNPVAAGEAGFSIHLTAGSSIPRVTASAGLFRDDDGNAQDVDIHQALASYILPVGSGIRIDFGKHVTHLGYEVIEGYDGVNDQATRSFLFGYSIPFTQTGLKLGYAFGPRLSASACLVNGWDNVRDNNRSKSVGAQLAVTPAEGVTVLINYLGGAERDSSSDLRHIVDIAAGYKIHPRFSVGVNFDYGREANAIGPGEDASWTGGAIYLRAAVVGPLALTARGEVFDDTAGFRTGVRQTLHEVTLTPELRVSSDFLLRVDLRRDRSDRSVFESHGGRAPRRSQSTITLNALCTF